MKKIRVLWLFTAILMVFNIVIFITRWGGDTLLLYVSDLLPIVCALVAIIFLFRAFKGFKTFDYAKTAWLLELLGIIMFLGGESTYAILEIVYKNNMNDYFPSPADYIWCLGYIPLFTGLIIMYIGYRSSGFPLGNMKRFITIASFIAIMVIAVIYFVLLPIVQDTETEVLTIVFSAFYPVADLFIIIPSILLMYITSLFGQGKLSRPWKYLALGFIFFSVSDIFYTYLSWKDLYGSGNLIDVGWNLGYLLLGFAGFYQRELVESFKERA